MYFNGKDLKLKTIFLFTTTVGGKTSEKLSKIKKLDDKNNLKGYGDFSELVGELVECSNSFFSDNPSDNSAVMKYCNNVSIGNSVDNSNEVMLELYRIYFKPKPSIDSFYISSEREISDEELARARDVISGFTLESIDKMKQFIAQNKRIRLNSSLSCMSNSEKIKLMRDAADMGSNTYGEKRVLAFIGAALDVDSLTIAEFIDTYDTIAEINNQKKWLKTLSRPYELISKRITELDGNLKTLRNNIDVIIKEADIA